jgi:hypothetical protein
MRRASARQAPVVSGPAGPRGGRVEATAGAHTGNR